MISLLKKTALGSFLAATLLIAPVLLWAQDSMDDLMKLHQQTDFDALMKRGQEMAEQAQAGQLGEMVYTERGSTSSRSYDVRGGISEVTITVDSVDGQTVKTEIESGLVPGLVLEIEGRLTVAKGSYKVEFRNKGQVSLTLEAMDGSSAEGTGFVKVDPQGRLPYEVTAVQAEGVDLTLKIK